MIRFLIPVCFLLSACADIQSATDKAGRDAAKTIIPEALAVHFPQVPKSYYVPFTDCIVDNADASDVQSLAADAVVGVDAGTADLLRVILARPETQQCLATRVSADLLTL